MERTERRADWMGKTKGGAGLRRQREGGKIRALIRFQQMSLTSGDFSPWTLVLLFVKWR